MITTLDNELVLALALPLLAVTTQVVISARNRILSYAKAQCIARISQMIVATEEPSDKEMRSLRLRFMPGTILDAIIFISEYIYGNALNRLSLVVEVCEVDYVLLHRIERAPQRRKAFLLSKLSQLSNTCTIAEYAEGYTDKSIERKTRIYATNALVAARPERAIRYITRLDFALTLHEVALLTHLMRRVGAPIAYTPMLTSENKNLQFIGVYLCQHFSIVDAEPHLQQIVESENLDLSIMALYTICSIRGELSTPQISNTLSKLAPYQRMAFIRHAVYSCYSIRSCAHLLNRRERNYFTQRINSYKCRIVCT